MAHDRTTSQRNLAEAVKERDYGALLLKNTFKQKVIQLFYAHMSLNDKIQIQLTNPTTTKIRLH